MTEKKRLKKLNSLLREVIAEVIMREVKDPRLAKIVSVTDVDITADLHQAKVYISVLGTEKEKRESLEALNSAKGFIGVTASKQVTMRYFPTLTFLLDTSVDKQIRIDTLLDQIHQEEDHRDTSKNMD